MEWSKVTPDMLVEARRIVDVSTVGPWSHAYARVISLPILREFDLAEREIPDNASDDDPRWAALPEPDICHVKPSYGDTCVGQNEKDATFIAASRTLVPALLDHIEALEVRNRQSHQDRYDALSVTSRDGLLSSEWLLRTGKAQRERDEAQRERDEAQRERDSWERKHSMVVKSLGDVSSTAAGRLDEVQAEVARLKTLLSSEHDRLTAEADGVHARLVDVADKLAAVRALLPTDSERNSLRCIADYFDESGPELAGIAWIDRLLAAKEQP